MNTSGSKIQHTPMTCPGARLLHNFSHKNQGASKGHAFHDVVETARNEGVDVALKKFARNPRKDIEPWVMGFDFDYFLRLVGNAETEVAYSWDSDSGQVRMLGKQIGRKYEISKTEIPGTADYIAIDGTHATLVDLKTGVTWVNSPQENWQLRFLAICIARHHKVETVEAHIAHVQPDGSSDYKPPAFWLLDDLDQFETQLKSRLEQDTIVVGEHCRWCDAFARCPAQYGTATALVEADRDLKGELTTERIAEIYPKLQAVKVATDRVEKALKEFVEHNGPVPLEGGKQLALVPGTWTKTYAVATSKVLRKHFGTEALKYLAVNQSDIKFTVQRFGGNPEAILEEISAEGGTEILNKRPSLRAVWPEGAKKRGVRKPKT